MEKKWCCYIVTLLKKYVVKKQLFWKVKCYYYYYYYFLSSSENSNAIDYYYYYYYCCCYYYFVILNKSDYIKRMTEMLSDIDKFKILIVKPGKELNLLLKHEDKLVSFLKGIKNILEKIYIKASIHKVHNQVSWMVHLKYMNHLLMAFLN